VTKCFFGTDSADGTDFFVFCSKNLGTQIVTAHDPSEGGFFTEVPFSTADEPDLAYYQK